MYKAKRVLLFKALSGIHAGSGTDLGIVDLPIQRERHTGFPKIESSGIKGCLREEYERKPDKDFVKVAFGPGENDTGEAKHSGALAFTDARILLFPVRSAKGVFAYTTCPLVLSRFKKDLEMAGITVPALPSLGEKALVTNQRTLMVATDTVILEEYSYPAEYNEKAMVLAKQIAEWLGCSEDEYVQNNFIILSDDDFTDFVKNATEIITRIRIDETTGTVKGGALFTEELLPTETVMYSLIMASSIFLPESEREDNAEKGWKKSVTLAKAQKSGDEATYLLNVIDNNKPKYLQLGGDATIGKGLVSISIIKGAH